MQEPIGGRSAEPFHRTIYSLYKGTIVFSEHQCQRIFILGFMILLQGKTKRNNNILTTPHDVPASKFIEKLAKYLKENVDEVQPLPWASFVKTGSHVEKQPQNPNWWYTRSASILRKVYIHGPLGLEKLRSDYGGRKGFSVTPNHASKAGGNNIRKILQQLEAAGLIQTAKPQGRVMAPKGRKLLQEIAEDVQKDMVKTVPELRKYQGE
jgi:small subunit ribosomal protein S19e